MQRLDHADLGVRGAAGDDEREKGELVDLVVRELVEAGGGHDHGIDRLLAHLCEVAGEDADLDKGEGERRKS